ncbi:hypothetical protein E2C01_000602 [Portunus trituberculatus]|uniref:Uncharacterized protein n=1 Tax=Portunus trituberculatus TaxID=210409 RepID=A0A5B7CEJ2_PORTR|nr:hypothetical protein [Portunus trituberculatus]
MRTYHLYSCGTVKAEPVPRIGTGSQRFLVEPVESVPVQLYYSVVTDMSLRADYCDASSAICDGTTYM